MAEKITFASVISNRGFRYLWLNQVLVQLALNTLNFALIIWVFKLVGTNLAVSALLLSIYLPTVLFGLFAGVFVDIADRKKIILLVDILLAFSFLFFILIKGSYPLILMNTFFVNSLAQFFMPSESSSIPLLVSKKQLFLANSLFSFTLYGAFMLGFSIGGPILNIFGINILFWVGSLLLLLAFITARQLPQMKVNKAKTTHLLTAAGLEKIINLTFMEIKETFRFIKGKINVSVAILLMAAVQGIIGILAVMIPSYLETTLRIHATDASYFVMLPLGFGMVSGALLIGRLFHYRAKRSLVIPAVILVGVILTLVGLLPYLTIILAAADLPATLTRPRYFFNAPSVSSIFAMLAYLAGLCTVSIIIPSQTVLQENTTQKNKGKIFAVLAVIMTSVSALPVILAGGLADVFGAAPVFIGVGIIIFLTGILALKPHFFLTKNHLPFRVIEFLGIGHWKE